MDWLGLSVLVVLLPTIAGYAVLLAIRGYRRVAESRRLPPPPEPVERLVTRLRKLRLELETTESTHAQACQAAPSPRGARRLPGSAADYMRAIRCQPAAGRRPGQAGRHLPGRGSAARARRGRRPSAPAGWSLGAHGHQGACRLRRGRASGAAARSRASRAHPSADGGNHQRLQRNWLAAARHHAGRAGRPPRRLPACPLTPASRARTSRTTSCASGAARFSPGSRTGCAGSPMTST